MGVSVVLQNVLNVSKILVTWGILIIRFIANMYNVLIINSCISVTGFIVLPSFRFLSSQSAHSSLLLPLHFTLYTIYMNMNQTKEDNIKIVENLNAVHAHNLKYINKNINASLISRFSQCYHLFHEPEIA